MMEKPPVDVTAENFVDLRKWGNLQDGIDANFHFSFSTVVEAVMFELGYFTVASVEVSLIKHNENVFVTFGI